LVVLLISACGSIGPSSVPRDRIGYVDAVADSWKEQTLLNIVRLRYGDAPSFLDVSSVISAYTFQGNVAAGAQFSSDLTSTIPRDLATVGAGASYQDRPTISYTPLSGSKFARSLLEPLPPSQVFELIQAGYPSDGVLQVTVRAINGIYNRSGMGGRGRDADPAFYPLLDALRRLQQSGAVSLRLDTRNGTQTGTLILSDKVAGAAADDLRFVARTLGVRLNAGGELVIVFGLLPRAPNEIAVLTRSMLEMLVEIAAGIDVPADHIAAGRTPASTRQDDAANERDRPLVRVHSGTSRPAIAYSAVRYGDTWYWIEDTDFRSKRTFASLMLFFSLAETGVAPQVPVLTVPAS